MILQDAHSSGGSATDLSEPDGTRRHPWARHAGRRLLGLVGIFVALIVITFAVVHLAPGDPAVLVAGSGATAAEIQKVRVQLGLTQPVIVQFGKYAANIFRFNLGRSYQTGTPVSVLLRQNLGNSLILAGLSLALVLLAATTVGLLGAYLAGNARPKSAMAFTFVMSVLGSVPEYLTATVLIFVFALRLAWLPVSGAGGGTALVLPVLSLSLLTIAILARITRIEAMTVLKQDFIRTARSKRIPGSMILRRHVLPNVLISTLTLGGLVFPALIGSAIVVENVFARPGIGTLLVNAIIARDYPVVQVCVLVLGMMIAVVNLIVDLIIRAIDPRGLARG
jgi:peptide/nickel transport system permease protein